MTFLSAIVLLGILIFVHELGHFLFAKAMNVKVLKFSLGFGPRLLGKKYGETEYLLSAVPLGGYVKMLGEDLEEEITDEERARAFHTQPVWKRLSIVLFGPLFNLFFAAVVFFFIFLSGVPVPKPEIGKVDTKSPSAVAGLATGDRVIEINGKAIRGWDDIERFLVEERGETLRFKIERGGDVIEYAITPEKKQEKDLFGESKETWDIGISPLVHPVIGQVVKGSRAEKAGVAKGDRIVEIEGTALGTWQDMTSIIHENPERPLRFRIKRDGSVIELTITPEKETFKTVRGEEKKIGLIGIRPVPNDVMKKYGPVESLSLGIERTWDVSVLTVKSIVKLIQRVIPAETIGGPVMIFQMAGQQASQGAISFFTFMAVISVNLGVLNLLPIPILDGGHILFLSIEVIRKKPLSDRTVMVAQRLGLAIIISLMVFALYNDIMRLITGKVMPW